MPKDWDLHRDEIERLYMARGFTLEKLREVMSSEHGLTASTRAWKMKLDEWNLRKNKSRGIIRDKFGDRGLGAREVSHDVESNTQLETTLPTNMPIRMSPELSDWMPDFPVSIPESSSRPPQSNSGNNAFWSNSSLNIMYQASHYAPMPAPSNNFIEATPLINSSLMFFSTRPPGVSLHLLASCSEQKPQALEILLRNWKPGGDYMSCAKRFLQDSDYCHTIVGVNWTRWNHRDETLFDLIDQFVPEDEQALIRRALLRADLKFEHPLGRLNAPWAQTWRLAIREKTWDGAKHQLLKMEVRDRLLRCALSVVAEALLRSQDFYMDMLALIGKSDLIEESRRHKSWILTDCREQQIDIDIP